MVFFSGLCEPIDSDNCKIRNNEFGEFCENEEFHCDSINDPGKDFVHNFSMLVQFEIFVDTCEIHDVLCT